MEEIWRIFLKLEKNSRFIFTHSSKSSTSFGSGVSSTDFKSKSPHILQQSCTEFYLPQKNSSYIIDNGNFTIFSEGKSVLVVLASLFFVTRVMSPRLRHLLIEYPSLGNMRNISLRWGWQVHCLQSFLERECKSVKYFSLLQELACCSKFVLFNI